MGAGASAQKGKGRSIATSPAGGNHGKASKQPSDLSMFAHRSWVMISHAEDVVSVVRCVPPLRSSLAQASPNSPFCCARYLPLHFDTYLSLCCCLETNEACQSWPHLFFTFL